MLKESDIFKREKCYICPYFSDFQKILQFCTLNKESVSRVVPIGRLYSSALVQNLEVVSDVHYIIFLLLLLHFTRQNK
jgi:hypothetical protein